MNRKTAWAAITAVLSVLAVLVTPTPASADVKVNSFKNYGTTWCLDYYAARGVYATDCNSGKFQQWIWNNDRTRATPMRQVQSDLCLTLRNPDEKVVMAPCDLSIWGPRQLWWVTYPAGGANSPFIKSAYIPEWCLHSFWDSVAVEECAGSGDLFERWAVL
ncbi:RICIN domain-containing protein [Streptomyces himalayensis]|uniref:Ricin-type beta-trefoil lectin domain protein n=1 Tax=Streptomyces himalayensis subsp. himalayensis TaxID=2756131 RepID=A0A7W0DSI7_9ACTN|nr:ricin-type beta-trefoil lectin domain protein [Streptomyces himalayensis]MBA2949599.1 ricin-type beta-trefoil lectin domain protein [Streptomyces himalayensis subsp. himalayensis]